MKKIALGVVAAVFATQAQADLLKVSECVTELERARATIEAEGFAVDLGDHDGFEKSYVVINGAEREAHWLACTTDGELKTWTVAIVTK